MRKGVGGRTPIKIPEFEVAYLGTVVSAEDPLLHLNVKGKNHQLFSHGA